jgi:thioredoxin reductase
MPALYEVLIVGAGPAGLSAALILGRCRRRVLLCDSGEPRNAVSPALRGFLSRDGINPRDLRDVARRELLAYATVEVRDVVVAEVAAERSGFSADLASGERIRARRVLLATGIVDELPEVPGLRDLYGRGVWLCPYCDGFELRGRPLAVYGRGKKAVAELRALSRYSDDLVLFGDGDADLDDEARECLDPMRVEARSERVASIEECMDGVAVLLTTGEAIERAALFIVTRCRQKSNLAERLGCKVGQDGLIATRDDAASGVPGLFVAGDASRSALLAIVAAGEGAAAALAINKELLREELGG